MPDLAEQFFLTKIDDAHIKNSWRLIRPFLFCILLLTLYTFGLHYFLYASISFSFLFWIVLSSIFFMANLVVIHYLYQPLKSSTVLMDRYLTISCLLTGVILAVGIFLIHYNLSSDGAIINQTHTLTLSSLLSFVSLTIALAFLTLRIRYFFYLCIPVFIPIVAAQFHAASHAHVLFYMAFNFAGVIMIICAYAAYHNHLRRSFLYFKNLDLKNNTDQHLQHVHKLNQQLQAEMQKSKNFEVELQQNNLQLEHKIKERIADIEQINTRLETHSLNLALAHEIANIHAWNWDIQQRRVEISRGTVHEKTILDWDQHRSALEASIHPDDLTYAKAALYAHLKGETARFESQFRVKTEHDTWKWVQDVGQVIARDPSNKHPLRMLGMRRDIDQEKQDQEKLKLAASVVHQVNEGIFILDQQLQYTDANPYFLQLTELKITAVLKHDLFDFMLPQPALFSLIKHNLIENGSYSGEVTLSFNSDKILDVWLRIHAVKNDFNRVIKYIGIMSDQTERKRQEKRLSFLKNYDILTDLPNRIYYHDQLHQILIAAEKTPLAIIRINIDRFRQLNELFTKQGADALLKQIAQRLRDVCENVRLLAYLNGDDFAILVDRSQTNYNIKRFCEQIFTRMLAPFQIQLSEHTITLSIGVAYYPEHGHQIDRLNNRAELALSQAKQLGGNTVCEYKHNQDQMHDVIDLERDLRKAILNKELVIFYQAKLCAKSLQVVGFEALVRWNHPQKGLLAPDYFIPWAQESSLISDIGRYVILETVAQIQKWHNLGFNHLTVSVNVVAQQLHRGELIHDIDQALQRFPIAAHALELEISESTLIDNSQYIKDILQQVKQRQIMISLDDFGKGYSSLAYLNEFPIDIIKIDRSFIAKIGNQKQEAIIGAMVAMAKTMGMRLVAEGVETEQQALFLKQLDCEVLQGYLYSKPLDANSCTEYLNKKQLDKNKLQHSLIQ